MHVMCNGTVMQMAYKLKRHRFGKMQISLAEIKCVGAWGRVVQASVRKKDGKVSRYQITSSLGNCL